MATIKVGENETLDSALRRFKRRCARDGIIGDLRKKEQYEKPSVTVDAVIFRIFSQENKNYRKLPEKKLQVFLKILKLFKDYLIIAMLYCSHNNERSIRNVS